MFKCIKCNDSDCILIMSEVSNTCELCSDLLLCYDCKRRAIYDYLLKRKNLLSYTNQDINNCIIVYFHVKYNGVGRKTHSNSWMSKYTDVMWQIANIFPFDEVLSQ